MRLTALRSVLAPLGLALATAVALSAPHPLAAQAQAPGASLGLAVTFTTPTTTATPPTVLDYTAGYTFTVQRSLFATSLGVFDAGQDGLAAAHAIGLWDIDMRLLASTTVAAGSGATLDGFFRLGAIGPVLLSPGQVYFVGALMNGDPYARTTDGLQAANGVTYDQEAQGVAPPGAGLAFPGITSSGGGGIFGGNVVLAEVAMPVSTVPEPATVALVGAGIVVLSGVARRGTHQRERTRG